MKKQFILFAITLFLFSSCAGIRWQMGETTDAFLAVNHKKNFELVRSSTEWTVYKWTNNFSYTDPPYFFYFHNGVLVQLDRGTRAPDVIIQNRY